MYGFSLDPEKNFKGDLFSAGDEVRPPTTTKLMYVYIFQCFLF